MKQMPIEVYSETPNLAVVKLPGKQFPGLVIPGDALHVLWGSAESFLNMARRGSTEQAIGEAERLAETLGALLNQYARVLTEHQIELPFRR